jgi:hypothetical protein
MEGERSGLTVLSECDLPSGLSAKATMEAHWASLCRDGTLPRRRDIDHGQMEIALPHAFILERVASGVGRLRVAGRALSELLGAEARGMPLSSLFAAPDRPALGLWLDRCLDRPGLVDLPVVSQPKGFRSGVTGRLLMLPLLDQDGQATRVLGGLFLDGPTRRARAPFCLVSEAPARWERIVRRRMDGVTAVGAPASLPPAGTAWPRLRLVVDNTR